MTFYNKRQNIIKLELILITTSFFKLAYLVTRRYKVLSYLKKIIYFSLNLPRNLI